MIVAPMSKKFILRYCGKGAKPATAREATPGDCAR